jgi:hypothetical protein
MSKEIETTVAKLLQSYGVPFSAQYAGEVTKADWGSDGKGQRVDAWRVSIGGFETDYFTGLGHRKGGASIAPSAAGVLYSLLMDAEAHDMPFAEWCDNFGYSSDSIKALHTYQQCEETARALKKVFTSEQMAELREALQDY